jgi:hypothetical protein
MLQHAQLTTCLLKFDAGEHRNAHEIVKAPVVIPEPFLLTILKKNLAINILPLPSGTMLDVTGIHSSGCATSSHMPITFWHGADGERGGVTVDGAALAVQADDALLVPLA